MLYECLYHQDDKVFSKQKKIIIDYSNPKKTYLVRLMNKYTK